MNPENIDHKTVTDFGEEWASYDQNSMSSEETQRIFRRYFSIFDFKRLPVNAVGFDLGCGSGRWAKYFAPLVGHLHCIDASAKALKVAKESLALQKNCSFHCASVDQIPLADGTMDFAYSLGVLHHIPNTQKAMSDCVKKLKVGAPFLVYLYYSLDNRPAWFRGLWLLSNIFRRVISQLPFQLKKIITEGIAYGVYFPASRFAKGIEILGINPNFIPLSFYRDKSLFTLRTDAMDRFGTRLEQRFSQIEIRQMMEASGLENIIFSTDEPYWCGVGYRKS